MGSAGGGRRWELGKFNGMSFFLFVHGCGKMMHVSDSLVHKNSDKMLRIPHLGTRTNCPTNGTAVVGIYLPVRNAFSTSPRSRGDRPELWTAIPFLINFPSCESSASSPAFWRYCMITFSNVYISRSTTAAAPYTTMGHSSKMLQTIRRNSVLRKCSAVAPMTFLTTTQDL